MKIIVALLFVVLSLLILGYRYQSNANQRDVEKFPPPGKLVKISGDIDVHLYCQGQGDVTVIFEAAQGDSSLDWIKVQSAVSKFTRVCAYDRPGLGWSSPVANVLTAQQIADNLHQALEQAVIAGPYVLVGHSIGGVYARAFAHQYPGDVVGLVFVDSAHENQRYRLPSDTMKETRMIKGLASIFRVLAPVGIPRAFKLADRMQGENFPNDVRPSAMARMYQSHFFKALFNEVKAAELNTALTEPPPDFGNTPLIVLSRSETNPGLPEEQFEQLKKSWGKLQQDLVKLSTNSQHIVAEKSGHYIHHDQPELVIDAIRQIVKAAQN
ncbi:MAG: alpha/beta hydrolase [Chloroflexi bacterium]|nr:alpha/beta hydrolase [Chloroflexota bacterium]